MASSQADRQSGFVVQPDAGPQEATSFALQEVTACWNQAYEALTRGDLEAVAELLDLVDEQLAVATSNHQSESPTITGLRAEAAAARGRLEHGMRSGLDGLAAELAQTRRGARTLQGYRQAGGGDGSTWTGRA